MTTTFTFEALSRLFGERYDSVPVQEFLSQMPPHKAQKPSDGSQYIICKAGGFDLLFEDYNTGGPGKKQDRKLTCIFFYNASVDKHERYVGPLPFQFAFDDLRPALIQKRPPSRTWKVGEGEVPVTYSFPDHDRWDFGETAWLSAQYGKESHEVRYLTLQLKR